MSPHGASRQLEAGQTTIIASLNGSLSARPIQPSPRPKKPKLQIPSDRRRMIGGPNEQAVLWLFADFRQQSRGDKGEDDLAEESNEDYTPRR
jgi:hypothetical protein